jgi:hypothetical protein
LKPQERLLDYNDYLKLPDDGKRYEIVEGELFAAPVPNPVHQRFFCNGADDETITSLVIKGLEINLSQIWS